MYSNRLVVIFDGDDTLWKTQELYVAATGEFYRRLEAMGFDDKRVRSLFRSLNRQFLSTMKLSRERRSHAMTETYAILCQESGRVFDPQTNADLLAVNERIYTAVPRPMENVQQVLSVLADKATLVFFSGGDEEAQRRRLVGSSLATYFGDRIYIVQQKDKEALRQILKEQGLCPEDTWMVGNSPRFDINPALELGLNCIWLHTGFWREDIEELGVHRIFVAFTLDEVLGILSHGTSYYGRTYVAPQKEQTEIKYWLEDHGVLPERSFLVGASPKYDINPGLNLGLNCIWLYASLGEGELEPLLGKVYVAFSKDQVGKILAECSEESTALEVLWRVREGDHGQEPEVHD